ncbi:putative glycosyl transferase [Chitinispirillum alkaliphilum]|nr:putative glycosyl transferase [Chitinispirillum alkaliphilum]
MTPRVSILLPSYNHENYIARCVESIMSQTYENIELIVIDDGSPDDSPKILHSLREKFDFTLICRENRGLIVTLNELFSLSGGEYICTFASDDQMYPDRIKLQVDYLQANRQTAAVCGLPSWIDGDGLPLRGGEKRQLRKKQQISFQELFTGRAEIHAATVMMRREVLSRYGGWNLDFSIEDLPLWLKMLADGYRIDQLNIPFTFYRQHGKNMHCNTSFMYQEIIRIVNCYRTHPLHNEAIKRWKTNWFSELAYSDKSQALRMLPKLAVFSFHFWIRTIKLLTPRRLLKW